MPRSQRVYWHDEHNSMKTANAYNTKTHPDNRCMLQLHMAANSETDTSV